MNELSKNDFPEIINFLSADMDTKRSMLAELDAKTGDGDLGVTIALIFRCLSRYAKRMDTDNSIGDIFAEMGETVEENAPSTFGTLVSTMLKSISQVTFEKETIDAAYYARMLTVAAEGVSSRGGAKLGDKTLLDALIPAGTAAKASADEGKDLSETARAAADAAAKGAEETEKMQAVIGRAGYMGERSIGTRDPGAEAIAQILLSFSKFCSSK